jgi:hypothetical protein
MVAYLTEQLAAGEYPHLQAIAGDDPAAGFARIGHLTSNERRFERGLQRLLDGREAWVEEARALDDFTALDDATAAAGPCFPLSRSGELAGLDL